MLNLNTQNSRINLRRYTELTLSIFVSSVLLISSAYAVPTMNDYQHLQEEKDKIQEQLDANQQTITTLETEKTELQIVYETLVPQVDAYQREVDAYDEMIAAKQEELDIAHQELDDQYEMYCARVRNIEEYGNTYYWSLIFQATDLKDLLARMDYIESVLEHDQHALGRLESRVKALDKQASELAELRADRNHVARQLNLLQHQLYNKIQLRIEEIANLEVINEQYIHELNRLSVQSAEIMRRLNSGADYNGTTDPVELYERYIVEAGELQKTPLGSQIAAFTLQYVGDPYVWGGASPEVGFDCSGMMYYVYGQFGFSIMRTAGMQYKYSGRSVSFNSLQAGDMVFFQNPDEPGIVSHVGMYVGDGIFVHAASRKSGIKISDLCSNYYSANYLGAKRVIP